MSKNDMNPPGGGPPPSTAVWPWIALGLGPEAEAGQIRAAYARALKTIDQQREAARFQALREARDEALALAARRAREAGSTARPSPEARGWPGLDGSDGAEQIFQPLDELLENPAARRSPASWARMLDDRPLMAERQAYEFERRIVQAVDDWLNEEELPAHEVFLLLDNTFGWSAIRSNLPDFLPRLQERRLRTIINSLRN